MFIVQHRVDHSFFHGFVGPAAAWKLTPKGAKQFVSENEAFAEVFLGSITTHPEDITVIPVPVDEAVQV